MAMSSEGENCEEYKVIKENLESVAHLVQVALPVLSNKLFSKNLISEFEHSNAVDKYQNAYNRATNVTMSVLSQIKTNRSCYRTFVTALKESDLGHVAEMLESSLMKKVSHSLISSQMLSGKFKAYFKLLISISITSFIFDWSICEYFSFML